MSTIRRHPVVSWSVVWAGSTLVESARFAYADGSAVLGWVGTISFAISSLALLYLGIRGLRRKTPVRFRNVLVGVAAVLALLFVFQRAVDYGAQTQIEDAITAAFTSTDPSYCYDDVTWTFLEQTTHNRRPFADDVCAGNSGQEPRARAVQITDISRSGGKATATVAPTGGTFNGSRLKVQIYHEGRWRVDRIIGFESFDRAGHEAAERALLALPGGGYPAHSAECVIRRERQFSDAEVEQALLGGNNANQLRLWIACDRPGFDRLLTRHFADPSFHDFPAPILSCVRRRVAEAPAEQLISYETDLPAWGALFVSCDRSAFLSYYRHELLDRGRGPVTAKCVIAALAALSNMSIARETADAAGFDRLISRCESTT